MLLLLKQETETLAFLDENRVCAQNPTVLAWVEVVKGFASLDKPIGRRQGQSLKYDILVSPNNTVPPNNIRSTPTLASACN